jgi:hypothetical protein
VSVIAMLRLKYRHRRVEHKKVQQNLTPPSSLELMLGRCLEKDLGFIIALAGLGAGPRFGGTCE